MNQLRLEPLEFLQNQLNRSSRKASDPLFKENYAHPFCTHCYLPHVGSSFVCSGHPDDQNYRCPASNLERRFEGNGLFLPLQAVRWECPLSFSLLRRG